MYCFSKAIQWPHLYNYGTHPTYKELLGSKANLEKKMHGICSCVFKAIKDGMTEGQPTSRTHPM